jgi:hypothetical protein
MKSIVICPMTGLSLAACEARCASTRSNSSYDGLLTVEEAGTLIYMSALYDM